MTLIEEFNQIVSSNSIKFLPSQINIVVAFADLCWEDNLDPHDFVNDPAFTVENEERIIAIQRFHEEIRYYAGAKKVNHLAPQNEIELGILQSINDGINLADQFLKGVSLKKISVVRKIVQF